MIISKCEFCGKEIENKYQSTIKKFCCQKCANSFHMRQRHEQSKFISITCEFCGKEFLLLESVKRSRENRTGVPIKYCSKNCMGLASRKRRPVSCLNCGKSFETTRNRFCSKCCAVEYMRKTGVHKKDGSWIENGYRVLYLEGNKSIKEHVKVMQDHIGRELKENEVVHHINGNKLDNRIENLLLMTSGTHSSYHRKVEFKNGKKFGKHVHKN